jgi:hypothetical protein
VKLEAVQKIALSFAGVEASTAYGSPAFKVDGKLMACIAINKSAEPNSLMVRVDFEDRDELLAGDPDLYYVTPHYEPYNAVLVRLSRVKADVLRDLLGMAYKFVRNSKKVPAEKEDSS